eukprot:2172896-Lingulodinium_polyedra.AAC.1
MASRPRSNRTKTSSGVHRLPSLASLVQFELLAATSWHPRPVHHVQQEGAWCRFGGVASAKEVQSRHGRPLPGQRSLRCKG